MNIVLASIAVQLDLIVIGWIRGQRRCLVGSSKPGHLEQLWSTIWQIRVVDDVFWSTAAGGALQIIIAISRGLAIASTIRFKMRSENTISFPKFETKLFERNTTTDSQLMVASVLTACAVPCKKSQVLAVRRWEQSVWRVLLAMEDSLMGWWLSLHQNPLWGQ